MREKGYAVRVLDSEKRAREKQASRDRDLMRLQSGEIDQEQLRRENSLFSSLPLRSFRIVAIGKRRILG